VTGSRTLSRDYKHVANQRPGGSQAFSGWMGLLIGLAIGLSVALGVFVHYSRQPAPEPRPAPTAAPASARATEEAPPPAEPANDYTFYDVLPNQEVEVPSEPERTEPAPSVLPKGDIVLQAGAFKQIAEAEKLQARLAQFGVVAKIQRISLQDETWYRVRIGPISTVEDYDHVRNKLAEAEIEATPVVPAAEPPLP
jgi:cell division protein FtsN